MKKILFILILFVPCALYARNYQEGDTIRNILIITAHPDDWELSMGGTAYLLKDRYHIHVIVASDGELGRTWKTTREPEPEMAVMRIGHSEKTAAMIHATNHFFHLPDGNMQAEMDAVERTISLLNELDPAIIFLHWPIDKSDHVAISAMALMALSRTGMMYDREVYFFEVGNLPHFMPEIYVDITSVWNVKKEMAQIHERNNDGTIFKIAEDRSLYHGETNHCGYAEGFIPYFPFTSSRNNKKTGCSLFGL